jgi:ADP-heptose:LPS heptosyltransferase
VESVLACLPPGSKVAVLRLRSLGDCVLTTPALDILKRHRPDLRIAVVVEDRFRAIFEGNPDVSEILPPSLAALRQWRPALCLNFHGGTRSAWMTLLSGARHRAGFAHYRRQFAYNVRIPRAQQILSVDRTVHTAEHLASAMFYLGVPPCEIPRAKLAAGSDAAPHAAVIHAVAASPAKTWPADRFLAVAARLRDTGLDPVFVGAASDDLDPFRAYRTLRGAPLAEVKALLSRAAFFLGNDSGPAHIAAAFGVPVVVLFGASNPDIWGPWRTPGAVLPLTADAADVIGALTRLRVAA